MTRHSIGNPPRATGARLCRSSLAGMIALAFAPPASAAPDNGAVSAGQAQISKAGNLTRIRQQSSRAVIDWRSFNVGADEAVNFIQPDARSATLNRVLGNDGSTILGHITANGSVYLINPNGVLFGAGAQVNVGGLVASTANISNANFMAGNDRFDQPGSASAKVENRGTIRINDRGIAALVGRQVSNSGFIVATLGKVALAGGDAFVLDLTGDRLVNLILDPAAMAQVTDAQGRPLSARVDNTGNIQANGGRIEFSADTVSRLLDNVINVQGDVRAVSVDSAGGVISLRGGPSTDVALGGVLQPGGRSGLIDVAGRDITLAPTAQLDLGQGADLRLTAARNLVLNAPLNALRDGSVAGAGLSATAGQDLSVNQGIALDDGALSLSALGGRLVAAGGIVLQAGNQAITLRGAGGVAVDRVLTSAAVDIASSAGAVEIGSAVVAPSTGPNAAPVAALTVTGARGITLHGALATGAIALASDADITLRQTSLESRAGSVGLQAGGRVAAGDAGIGLVAPAGRIAVVAGGDLALAGAYGGTGGVSIDGGGGVTVGTVVTPGSVLLRSGNGGVSVASAITGSAASALADAAPARAVRIEAAGDVSLAGARAGTGGITVTGTSGGAGAGSFTLSGGSLLSDGDVSVTSVGALRTKALIQAGGSIRLTAATGTLTVGSAGVRATTAGRGIDLLAGGNLQLNGDLQAQAATISVTSTGGSVTALVGTPGVDPVAADAAIDAGSDAQASKVVVNAKGDVTLGSLRAASSASIGSANGNVMLLSPLGGASTGYLNFDNGYQTNLRPDVGSLTVSAPKGSVELNGLNLDGLADPHATGTGFSVTAGRMVFSNGTIAVNKGDIVLQGGNTQAGDGVYLGSSVYSRGWDSVGSDGVRNGAGMAADEKVGYGIRIAGRNLGLFDNNVDVADVPGLFIVKLPGIGGTVYTDSQGYVVNANGMRPQLASDLKRVVAPGRTGLAVVPAAGASDGDAVYGQPIARTIDKVEVANNVANYQDSNAAQRDRLVPLTNAASNRQVQVDVGFIGGVTNSTVSGDGRLAGRASLATFAPVMGPLSEAPVQVTPSTDGGPKVPSTRGIALKLLGFEGASDTATDTWNTRIAFGGLTAAEAARPLDPSFAYGADPIFTPGVSPFVLTSNTPQAGEVTAPFRGAFSLAVIGRFVRGAEVCDNCLATYQLQRLQGVSSNGLQLSVFAKVLDIQIAGQAASAVPWGPTDVPFSSTPKLATRIGAILQIRYSANGTPLVSSPGASTGVDVRGSLLAASGSPFGGSVADGPAFGAGLASGGVVPPGLPSSQVTLAAFQQGADGSLNQTGFLGAGVGVGYLLGRVIVDSSTAGTYDRATQQGTRVQVFDGVLDTQIGRTQTDGTGGANFIPGFGGIPGKNNSTTGFASVGASVGSSAGRSGATATSAAAARPVGAGTGAGVGAAPAAAADPGFVPNVVPVADRSAQDALPVADADAATRSPEETADLIEIGQGPASQADLGRSGSLAGATTNVFKRSYQVASSADAMVCAPGTIVSRDTAPRAPSDSSTQVAPSASARDCKPPRR